MRDSRIGTFGVLALIFSAIVKVAATEFLWYGTNRALQLKGGAGYMRDEPYEKVLRDTRIFPIFEGANDVLLLFIALNGIRTPAERLRALGSALRAPLRNLGLITAASFMGAIFALGAATSDFNALGPKAASSGITVAFAVSGVFVLAALLIAVLSNVPARRTQPLRAE